MGEMNYFDFIDRKTAPKPSHKRPAPAPAALKNMTLNDRVTEVARRPREDEIVVEESTASDSMIMRIIGKIRGQ